MSADSKSSSSRKPALLFVLAAVALAVVPLAAQQPQTNVMPNTLWVGADGKFESDPDTVLLQCNISAQEDKLPAAYQRAQKAAEQIRQLLTSNGLNPKDAQIGTFSVEPVYDYQNPKRKLVGYRVNSDISIKFKDFSKIGPLTDGLSSIDVTSNQSISYMLEDIDAAKAKAVTDAMRRAHSLAEAAAAAAGRSLGELSYASVDTFEPGPRPIMRPMAMQMKANVAAAAPAPTEDFGAQKITVTAHVNALYGFK